MRVSPDRAAGALHCLSGTDSLVEGRRWENYTPVGDIPLMRNKSADHAPVDCRQITDHHAGFSVNVVDNSEAEVRLMSRTVEWLPAGIDLVPGMTRAYPAPGAIERTDDSAPEGAKPRAPAVLQRA